MTLVAETTLALRGGRGRGISVTTTEEVWTGFNSRLRSYIAARSRNQHDAEDILQEVFVKVHRHLTTVDDDRRLASWLFRVTHNTIIDHYRRRVPIPVEQESNVPEPDHHPVAERQLAPFLAVLIEDLPDRYREALTLSELGDTSQVELADRLGLSVSGAKSRVQRGRALLRKQLLQCCSVATDCRGRVMSFTLKSPFPITEDCQCAASLEIPQRRVGE
jgi:RNA polymerase sigma-70 factor (ECF subfamily)